MRALLLVAGVAVGCDTIPVPAQTNAPVNSCTDTCAGSDGGTPTTCAAGTCVVPGRPEFTLVVQVPLSSYRAPGTIFALSAQQIRDLQKNGPVQCASADDSCGPLALPPRAEARGVLEVQNKQAKGLWPPAGLQCPTSKPDVSCPTTLPATARLKPGWIDSVATVPVSPLARGIPLRDVEAVALPFTFGVAPGPNGGGALGFDALLQGTSTGVSEGIVQYGLELDPVPPYDSAFPPVFLPVQFSGLAQTQFDLVSALDVPALPADTVPSLIGAPDLTGFTAYLMQWPDGDRVSNVITLNGSTSQTLLFATAYQTYKTLDKGALIIAPPPGSVGVPTVVVASPFGGVVAPFPKLLPPVVVEGTVSLTDPITGAVPVSAEIVFDAGPNQTITPVHADNPNPDIYNLTYRTTVQVGSSGAYRVTLPPGVYDVWVTPSDPALARTQATRDGHSSVKLTVNSDPIQRGKSLTVEPRAHLIGRAITFDGRPLAGATVVASPSPGLYTPQSGFERDLQTAALAWPRESATTTDDQGNYSVAVDSGLLDLTIRPADESRFPWTLSLDYSVAGDDVNVGVITVPAPMTVRWQLTDDLGNRTTLGNGIPSAIVSAYMTPTDGRPARLVGRALTRAPDPTTNLPPPGFFELFLPPCANPDSSGECPKP